MTLVVLLDRAYRLALCIFACRWACAVAGAHPTRKRDFLLRFLKHKEVI
jgi:hypothetical protein